MDSLLDLLVQVRVSGFKSAPNRLHTIKMWRTHVKKPLTIERGKAYLGLKRAKKYQTDFESMSFLVDVIG